MENKNWLRLILAVFASAYSTLSAAATIEVIHSWKQSTDIQALELLEAKMSNEGVTWIDTEPYHTSDFESLNSRVFNGEAPAAVELKDLDYKQWARLGFLANLNAIASAQEWDRHIPSAIADVAKYEGKYVSVPVSVHRTNWFWVNDALLKRLKLPVPKDWKTFDRVAYSLMSKGYPVVSLTDDPEQLAQLFESLVLSTGGAELYRDVFVDHVVSSYKREEFKTAIDRFYNLLSLSRSSEKMAEGSSGFDFLSKDAAFVFTGDWVSQSVNRNGERFSEVYQCTSMPGKAHQFVFKTDSFVFFNLPNIFEQVQAQTMLAELMLDDGFQRALNIPRDSIAVRDDVSVQGFGECARQGMADVKLASKNDLLVPSVVYGMATTASVTNHYVEQINELATSPKSVDDSAKALSRSIRLGNYIMK